MVSSCARTKEASQAKYISILNIIQGEVDPTQVTILCQINLGKFLWYALSVSFVSISHQLTFLRS